jgi:DNA-binding NtrC family response regulator
VRKVLLVEDDVTQLRIRAAVIRGAGFEVITAQDAESALETLCVASAADGDSTGIIITDHLLPGITGAEFLRQIRETDANMTVVVLSGLPGVEAEYEGPNVIFRQKPCPPADLISLVRRSIKSAA